jgi:dipeptidase E
MKLLLASQGFTTPDIANAVAGLVGKPLTELNVAVINEAYVGIPAGRHEGWLINELSQVAQYAKGTISFVNLRAHDLAEIKQRLEFADLIYIVGGAQAVLPKLFREIGFDKLLPELAQTKIIMGTSAGANVLGRQIEDVDYWKDQYGSSEEYLAEPMLGLVNFNILPHFEREDQPLRTREKLVPLLKDHPFLLYGVTDTQAVIFNEGKVEFVGGRPVIFGKQK